MKGEFRIKNPDDVLMTLELTMSLQEWKLMRGQINSRWPGWQLQATIDAMVSKAEQGFEETGEWFSVE